MLFILSGLCFASVMVAPLFFRGSTAVLPFSAWWIAVVNMAVPAIGIHAYVKIGEKLILLGFAFIVCIDALLLTALLWLR